MTMPNEISGALLLSMTILLIISIAAYAGPQASMLFALALVVSLGYWLFYERLVRRRVKHALRRPTWAFWAQIVMILGAASVVLWVEVKLGILLLICSLIGYGLGIYCARSLNNGD